MIPPRFTPEFEKVACQEGFTLRESLSGQLMHSQVGPLAEANQIYVGQSELGSQESLVLYDVGMGTAANAIALAERWSRPLQIFSFEKYPETLKAALDFDLEFLQRWPVRELLKNGHAEAGSLKWNLIQGDFLATDLNALPSPDLVYFDFYSPAKCPELWTEEVFRKLYEKSPKRLITYASNKSVRAAMLTAGFYVGKGASTSMKLETTVAGIEPVSHLLGSDWFESLSRSPKNLPLEKLRNHPQFS